MEKASCSRADIKAHDPQKSWPSRLNTRYSKLSVPATTVPSAISESWHLEIATAGGSCWRSLPYFARVKRPHELPVTTSTQGQAILFDEFF